MLDALNEMLGAAHLPAARRRRRSARLPACGNGRLSLKLGKFGAFIGCSNYPECRYTRQLADERRAATAAAPAGDGTLLGDDPETGLQVTLRTGRFGPYVQLRRGREAEAREPAEGLDAPRPSTSRRRSSCCRCRARSARIPETGKPIIAGIGRYGPFVEHDGKYANLDSVDEVFTVGAEPRRRSLLAEKQSRGGGRAAPRPRR